MKLVDLSSWGLEKNKILSSEHDATIIFIFVFMKRMFFFFLGIIFLVLAYFGILLPGVPAIPFILLSSWFFLNSSDKLYTWMLHRRFIGPVLRKFHSSENVPKKMKWFVISQLWISVIVALIVFPLSWTGIILVNLGGVLGTIALYKLIK